VKPFRRGELDYFFAYPEDHSQQSPEWVNGEFANRPHNPAFEVVFVYSQKEGSLDLNFRGSCKAIKPLQEMFCTAILQLNKIPTDPKDGRVHDLNPLRQKADQRQLFILIKDNYNSRLSYPVFSPFWTAPSGSLAGSTPK